jgi:hypothetical protein
MQKQLLTWKSKLNLSVKKTGLDLYHLHRPSDMSPKFSRQAHQRRHARRPACFISSTLARHSSQYIWVHTINACDETTWGMQRSQSHSLSLAEQLELESEENDAPELSTITPPEQG